MITSYTHAHPLAQGDFVPMAMQLSASLDPRELIMEAFSQWDGLICGQASPRAPDDLYHTFPQCLTLSVWLGEYSGRGWRLDRVDTEAETHLKQRSFSFQPQKKFAGQEAIGHMLFLILVFEISFEL